MFPLQSVLVPGAALPLHVFELRYREMVHDVLAGDRRFGVVLIERGREVGGGDQRADVGTMAEVVEAAELDDGRWQLLALGRERLRVTRWLADDPYPAAQVEPWPDEPSTLDPATRDRAERALRTALALATELGLPAPPATLELGADPGPASWTAVAAAPLGSFDRQQVLVAPSMAARWALLADLLADAVDALRARLT